MAVRLFVSPALIVVAALAGCSSTNRTGTAAAGGTGAAAGRDLHLADGADSALSVVSDIEAGRASKPEPLPRLERRSAPEVAPAAAKARSLPAAAILERAPKLSSTAALALPVALVAAPAAPEMVESVRYNGSGTQETADEGFSAAPISRLPGGPTVIIRGGRGGIDDDCDIHRPGIHRFGGGMGGAVHSLIPPIGGHRRGR